MFTPSLSGARQGTIAIRPRLSRNKKIIHFFSRGRSVHSVSSSRPQHGSDFSRRVVPKLCWQMSIPTSNRVPAGGMPIIRIDEKHTILSTCDTGQWYRKAVQGSSTRQRRTTASVPVCQNDLPTTAMQVIDNLTVKISAE